MIIKGGARANAGWFAGYLSAEAGQDNDNDRATLREIRGTAANDVDGFFQEIGAVASGTNATNFFYHAHLNPDRADQLTSAQRMEAVNILEQKLGFTGQPRVVVEHEKPDGRVHTHVCWSRIDLATMTAIDCGNNFQKHERAAREIEQRFDLVRVESVLEPGRTTPRPERAPQDWEGYRAQKTGISPKAMKAELTGLWHATATGQDFAAGLDERGYLLARGDRRDFVVLDEGGDAHSLARRIEGARAADIRARMADIDRAALPSVEEGRAIQFDRAATRAFEPEFAPAPEPARETVARDWARYTPPEIPDPGRASERALMVAADVPGQAAGTLADFVSGLAESFFAPPPPKPTAFELAINPAARRENYAREGAERRSEDALERTRAHMEAGRALRPEDIRALTPEHLINIRAKGDAYLQEMVIARQKEMDDRGRERD